MDLSRFLEIGFVTLPDFRQSCRIRFKESVDYVGKQRRTRFVEWQSGCEPVLTSATQCNQWFPTHIIGNTAFSIFGSFDGNIIKRYD